MNVIQAFLLIILSSLFTLNVQRPLPVKETQIVLSGDVMLGRSVLTRSTNLKDPLYPFRLVKDTLSRSDIILANLEAPFVGDCPVTNSGMTFCASPDLAQGLTYAGINIVNLANNHILNYGKNGLENTKKVLDENHILYTGVGNLAIKEVNKIKFGFLGFDLVDNRFTETDQKLISESKTKVDVLIVSVHWGSEYQDKASPEQKRVAALMAESGADVVVGTHPHWVEDIEKIDNTSVYYSLGNFVFDQMWSEETKKGLAVKLTYSGSNLIGEEKMPVYIKNLGQPEFVK